MNNNFKYAAMACIFTTLVASATLVQAGVAVVVGSKSPAGTLTSEQAAQLFLGKTATLPGAGAAVLIDEAEGSPVRDAFYTKVAAKNAQQMKALWSRLLFSGSAQPPKVGTTSADVKHLLNDNPNAVGYLDTADIDGSVKVLLKLD
jgi:hypothetical protein